MNQTLFMKPLTILLICSCVIIVLGALILYLLQYYAYKAQSIQLKLTRNYHFELRNTGIARTITSIAAMSQKGYHNIYVQGGLFEHQTLRKNESLCFSIEHTDANEEPVLMYSVSIEMMDKNGKRMDFYFDYHRSELRKKKGYTVEVREPAFG